MRFEDLGLIEPLTRAVLAEGYTVPTPIQANAIPPVLAGHDVLGCAQTGTGKTAAFALPILQRLHLTQPAVAHAPAPRQAHPGQHQRGRPHRGPASHARGPVRKTRALILSPTRELATQIGDSFRTYGKFTNLRHTVIFGGVGQGNQTRALGEGVDIIVATPGRLLDLMNQGYVDLSGIEVFVLDEADRMLDMGFIHDIRKIVAKVPAQRQTLFFSATMPADIRKLADSILRNPVSVQVAPVASTAERIDQSMYYVDKRDKSALLAHLLESLSITRALVFTRTKHGADNVARRLHHSGVQAEVIHGNKSQGARERALANFKSGKSHVMIATDIAARGIDIDEISHVFNFDVPNVAETYVHRIGRTARAGASGAAISFCDGEERMFIRDIERLTKIKIAVCKDTTFNPAKSSAQDDHFQDRPRQSHSQHPRHPRPQGHGTGHPRKPALHPPKAPGHAPAGHAPKPSGHVSKPSGHAPKPAGHSGHASGHNAPRPAHTPSSSHPPRHTGSKPGFKSFKTHKKDDRGGHSQQGHRPK